MRLVMDIDGTICTDTKGEYHKAEPFPDKILILNRRFDMGDTIVFHTGRHWNNLELTYKQLQLWGAKYHALVMGKPPADFLSDDKAFKIEDLK